MVPPLDSLARAFRDAKPAVAFVMAIVIAGLAWFAPMGDWARVLLSLLALVCAIPSLNWLVEWLEGWRQHRLEIKRRPEVLAHLSALGPREVTLLADCLELNEPSFTCELANPTAVSLCHKGLAKPQPWSGDSRRHPHIILDYVWEEAKRRKQEILSAADAQERAQAEQRAAEPKRRLYG